MNDKTMMVNFTSRGTSWLSSFLRVDVLSLQVYVLIE